MRVLLVEDNILHMTLLKEQIMNFGIQDSNIACTFDGLEAVKLMENNIIEKNEDSEQMLFSLIITDYCVPCVSGLEIMKKAERLF